MSKTGLKHLMELEMGATGEGKVEIRCRRDKYCLALVWPPLLTGSSKNSLILLNLPKIIFHEFKTQF